VFAKQPSNPRTPWFIKASVGCKPSDIAQADAAVKLAGPTGPASARHEKRPMHVQSWAHVSTASEHFDWKQLAHSAAAASDAAKSDRFASTEHDASAIVPLESGPGVDESGLLLPSVEGDDELQPVPIAPALTALTAIAAIDTRIHQRAESIRHSIDWLDGD
jgi:hypothetical protein